MRIDPWSFLGLKTKPPATSSPKAESPAEEVEEEAEEEAAAAAAEAEVVMEEETKVMSPVHLPRYQENLYIVVTLPNCLKVLYV